MSTTDKRKVLVLGASGMAGHLVTLYLKDQGFSVDTLAARHKFDEKTYLLDLTNLDKFKGLLESETYGAIVNCTGILVKQSEENKDLAVYINSYLPHFLENYYKKSEAKVIHISTDDVFSYAVPPYREDTPYDGQSFYGRTKALGEIINAKDVTFRTSIIGPCMREKGSGLLSWFFQQKGAIKGYTKSIWNGITTLELAKAMHMAIEKDLSGLYNLVPDDSISKFDLLSLLKDEFDRDIQIEPVAGSVINKSLVNTRKDFRHKIPDYSTMIRDIRIWMENHPDIYKNYEK